MAGRVFSGALVPSVGRCCGRTGVVTQALGGRRALPPPTVLGYSPTAGDKQAANRLRNSRHCPLPASASVGVRAAARRLCSARPRTSSPRYPRSQACRAMIASHHSTCSGSIVRPPKYDPPFIVYPDRAGRRDLLNGPKHLRAGRGVKFAIVRTWQNRLRPSFALLGNRSGRVRQSRSGDEIPRRAPPAMTKMEE